MKNKRYVSVHGGHSGEFCDHARDRLEEMIQRYIALGFSWVGITEHIPPPTDALRYPDEVEKGHSAAYLQDRFARYMQTCRRLQARYHNEISLFTGFETEAWTDAVPWIRKLINRYKPDYIVGSVHHVDNCCIDYSPEMYHAIAAELGGIDTLYCRYFDLQFDLIDALRPAVVGHFDLVRLFDDHYEKRLIKPEIWQRVIRNLLLIQSSGAVLDYNTRALKKGAGEPYICRAILKTAQTLNIRVMPGDDSHCVDDIGEFSCLAATRLERAGIDMNWKPPHLSHHPAGPQNALEKKP